MIQAHFKITGKVQGVFYRAHAQEEAVRLGLKGIIQNMPDGSVEATLQAQDQGPIDQFKEWALQGSPSAEPAHVEMTLQEPVDMFKDVVIQ